MFRKLRWSIGTLWCNLTHESLLWPVHGHYQCRTCGRRYPAFAEAAIAGWRNSSASSGASQSPVSAGSATASLSRA